MCAPTLACVCVPSGPDVGLATHVGWHPVGCGKQPEPIRFTFTDHIVIATISERRVALAWRVQFLRLGSSGRGGPAGKNLPEGDLGGIGVVESREAGDWCLD